MRILLALITLMICNCLYADHANFKPYKCGGYKFSKDSYFGWMLDLHIPFPESDTEDSINGECEDCQSLMQSYEEDPFQYKPNKKAINNMNGLIRGCVSRAKSKIASREKKSGKRLEGIEIDRLLYPCYQDLQHMNISASLDKYNQLIDHEIKRYEIMKKNVLGNTLGENENISLNSMRDKNLQIQGIDKVMETFGDIKKENLTDEQLDYCIENKIIPNKYAKLSKITRYSEPCAEKLKANKERSCHKISPSCKKLILNSCYFCKLDLEKKLSKLTDHAPELKFLSKGYELSEGEKMSEPVPLAKDGKRELLIKGIDQHLSNLKKQRSDFNGYGGDVVDAGTEKELELDSLAGKISNMDINAGFFQKTIYRRDNQFCPDPRQCYSVGQMTDRDRQMIAITRAMKVHEDIGHDYLMAGQCNIENAAKEEYGYLTDQVKHTKNVFKWTGRAIGAAITVASLGSAAPAAGLTVAAMEGYAASKIFDWAIDGSLSLIEESVVYAHEKKIKEYLEKECEVVKDLYNDINCNEADIHKYSQSYKSKVFGVMCKMAVKEAADKGENFIKTKFDVSEDLDTSEIKGFASDKACSFIN